MGIGKVIFINGPSSSGKSTLIKLLQEKLMPEPYMAIGIDKLIGMMPESVNDWVGCDILHPGFWWQKNLDSKGEEAYSLQLGPYAQKVNSVLKDIVVTMANSGLNVIVDEICLSSESYAKWQDMLAPFQKLYVGVHCATEILEKREMKRGDRMVGSAKAQNKLVHVGKTYDLDIDTGKNDLQICVDKIVGYL